MDDEKKYTSITFRPPPDLLRKINHAKKMMREKNTSKVVSKALETGIDLLEASGWDLSKAYTSSLVHPSKTTANPAPPQSLQLMGSPQMSTPSTHAAGAKKR